MKDLYVVERLHPKALKKQDEKRKLMYKNKFSIREEKKVQ
jgi:hypothetical protein